MSNNVDRRIVAERAYFKWLDDGAPPYQDGEKYWYEAEKELTKVNIKLKEITADMDEVIEIEIEPFCERRPA